MIRNLPALAASVILTASAVVQAPDALAQGGSEREAVGAATASVDDAAFARAFSHHTASVNGVQLHYVAGGAGPPDVLLHGWPQTWRGWRGVMPGLADAGYAVIAPDYRGAGHSDKPAGGYDKATMARDVRALVRQLGHDRVRLVGHDIGLMVAYAYAAQFPDEVERLVLMDAPLPGTSVFEELKRDPRTWHFPFHQAQGVPEMLVAGREREYLSHFYHGPFTYDPSGVTEADIDAYVAAYRLPGASRAGFELYRAFPQDEADNRAFAKAKLPMPVLALGGEMSFGEAIVPMAREVATDARGGAVPGAGHWIAEENPACSNGYWPFSAGPDRLDRGGGAWAPARVQQREAVTAVAEARARPGTNSVRGRARWR
jgi:pimeloyl-ACP methyl ester carboxylesterase